VLYDLVSNHHLYELVTGGWESIDSGVAQIAAALDSSGRTALFDLKSNGILDELTTSGWTQVGTSGVVASDGSIWYLGTATVDSAGDHGINCLNQGQVSSIPGSALQLTTVNGLISAVGAGGATTILGFGYGDPTASAAYSNVQGTLYAGSGGPSYLDVEQGAEGDCWLLSSLAEVAARAPSDITSMFTYDGTTTENGSAVGLYTVRFYNKNSGQAEYVMVDTELPGGGTNYDQVTNALGTTALWVALAEKAYAVANGAGIVTTGHPNTNSYDALNGGSPSWALQAITGKYASDSSINSTNLANCWSAGDLIVLCTSTPTSSYIVGNHAYAVVGYNASSSQPFEIFNPWGTMSASASPSTPAWAPNTGNTKCGLFWASPSFISQNFNTQSLGTGAINVNDLATPTNGLGVVPDVAGAEAGLTSPGSRLLPGMGIRPRAIQIARTDLRSGSIVPTLPDDSLLTALAADLIQPSSGRSRPREQRVLPIDDLRWS
jgi:hypothetical protein